MSRGVLRVFLCSLLLLMYACIPAAAAEAVEPVCTEVVTETVPGADQSPEGQNDSGSQNRDYLISFPGIGEIISVVQPGGTAEAAAFEIPGNLSAFCGKNGTLEPYQSRTLLLEPGSYTLTVKKKEAAEDPDAKTGVMHFTLNGELFSQLTQEDYDIMAEATSSEALFSDAEETELKNPELVPERDPDSSFYRYRAGQNMTFSMSVPNGALSTKAVMVRISESFLAYRAYQDGKTFLMKGKEQIFREPGHYQLYLLGTEHDEDTGNGIVCYAQIYFTISPELTRAGYLVSCPMGFRSVSAERNGETISAVRKHFFTDAEGTYSFVFAAENDPELTYQLQFTADRTAPGIMLEQQDGKKLRAPCRFSVTEENCRCTLIRGIEETELTEPVITQEGNVLLKAEDPAGNVRTIPLTVAPAFRPFPMIRVILSAAAVLALLFGLAAHAVRNQQIL